MTCHKWTRCYNGYATHKFESLHEVSAFLSPNCGRKGAVETSAIGCLVQFNLVGSRLLGCSFLYMKKQSTLTEIKENISYLLGIVFFGFIYSIGILALLGMVLNWTLGINITEFDTSYRLIFLVWGLCVVGQHLYFKHDEERKIEAQLELLRQGKSVYYPRPTLMERWEKEKKSYENTN